MHATQRCSLRAALSDAAAARHSAASTPRPARGRAPALLAAEIEQILHE